MSTQTPSTEKHAVTIAPIHDLLAQRWSPRAYNSRAVEPEKLQSVLEAARWSASSSNMQPWSFIIARREADADAFERMIGCLMDGNVPWASKAPVLGIAVANLYRKPEVKNRHAFHDVGMATQNLVIQATALDLYVHLMGGFSPDKARDAFAIPAEYDAIAMFTLGYLGDPSELPERYRNGETAARTRKPLTEFVFTEQWGAVSPILTEG